MQSYLAKIVMILVVDHETDKPEESINEQDHADHNSPAIANASPANVESSSVESPPVDIKDMSSNGNNSPISGGNTFRSNT